MIVKRNNWFVLFLAAVLLISGCSSGAKTVNDLKNIKNADDMKEFAADVAKDVSEGAKDAISKAADDIAKAVEEKQAQKEAEEAAWAADPLSILFHQDYLDDHGIKPHYQSERMKIGGKIRKALETDPIHITEETRGLFENHYYAVTINNNSEYLYYGKTKDNRPNGFGVLTTGEVDPDDFKTFDYLVYAGDFKEGCYDGYGALFAARTEKVNNSAYSSFYQDAIGGLIQAGALDADDVPLVKTYLSSYVKSDGNWSKGEADGKMNEFQLHTDLLSQNNSWGDFCQLEIYITDTKSGKSKHYENSILTYDGEMDGIYRHGTGTSYYNNGKIQYEGQWKKDEYSGKGKLYGENGKLIYDGQWKKGKYDGTGKLYNEDGKLIYNGKWKNGDYAT